MPVAPLRPGGGREGGRGGGKEERVSASREEGREGGREGGHVPLCVVLLLLDEAFHDFFPTERQPDTPLNSIHLLL